MKNKKHSSTDKTTSVANIKYYGLGLLSGVVLMGVVALSTSGGRAVAREFVMNITTAIKHIFSDGTTLPVAKYYGIDVSRYQADIDWEKVKDIRYNKLSRRQGLDEVSQVEISFVACKATEGSSHKDSHLASNRDGVRDNGLIYGAYHVMSIDSEAQKQVNNFHKTAKLHKGDMLPIIDLEESILGKYKPSDVRKKLSEIVSAMAKKYGSKPIIYCGEKFAQKLELSKYYAENPQWRARYGSKSEKNKEADIWQFSETGEVEGIKTMVDLDAFCSAKYELKDLLIK